MATPTPRKPPLPAAQAFVVCRDIYEDVLTREMLLIAPFSRITLPFFPAAFQLSLFAHLSGGHGTYVLGLELRDDAGSVSWGWQWPEPLHYPDPLEPYRINLRHAVMEFARPGRYDLVLLANGEDLANHSLQVALQGPV